MSDFKAKMYPNRFRLGLCPRLWGSAPDSAEGAYSAPPDTGKKRTYFYGKGRGGKDREGKAVEGR